MNNALSSTHRLIGMRLDQHWSMNLDSSRKHELLKIMGCKERSFDKILVGTKELRLSELIKLAEFFDTSVSTVVSGEF